MNHYEMKFFSFLGALPVFLSAQTAKIKIIDLQVKSGLMEFCLKNL
jgi:hypothetical protein